MAFEVRMPRLTQTMDEGRIIEWLKPEGTEVQLGEPLLVVETDKASVEVESPAAGLVGRPAYGSGQLAAVGEVLVSIHDQRQGTTAEVHRRSQPLPAKVRATPAARRAARELGVNLALVKGGGPDGCVLQADVRAHSSAIMPSPAAASAFAAPGDSATPSSRPVKATPVARKLARELGLPLEKASAGSGGRVLKADVESTGPGGREAVTSPTVLPYGAPSFAASRLEYEPAYREEELSRIGRSMAARMASSWRDAPHFYLEAEADMSEIIRLRERRARPSAPAAASIRPSITAIVVRVVGHALRHHPRVNASIAQDKLRVRTEVNVGVAMASPEGLIVPVIRHADAKTVSEIARELEELRTKAEKLRFKPEELSGGTFTVSNLGMFGVDRFFAILNPPEAAILACGRIVKRVIEAEDGKLESRPLMSLVLSVDHRVLDGITAASFLGRVRECLEYPYLLL